MAALDILARTRELIATPAQWTQGAMARDADKRPVDPSSADAVCWSLFGAFLRAVQDEADEECDLAQDALMDGCAATGGGASLTHFNDRPGRTHAQVLAAIQAGIESLKGQP